MIWHVWMARKKLRCVITNIVMAYAHCTSHTNILHQNEFRSNDKQQQQQQRCRWIIHFQRRFHSSTLSKIIIFTKNKIIAIKCGINCKKLAFVTIVYQNWNCVFENLQSASYTGDLSESTNSGTKWMRFWFDHCPINANSNQATRFFQIFCHFNALQIAEQSRAMHQTNKPTKKQTKQNKTKRRERTRGGKTQNHNQEVISIDLTHLYKEQTAFRILWLSAV